MYAIIMKTVPVSMNEFDNSFRAPDKMNYKLSPPKHFSEHTFKSLKYDVAPGESVYSTNVLAVSYFGSSSVPSTNLS
jgi:hypothetical protein